VSLDRTERTELPEHDRGIKRAVDKGVRAEQLGQDSWDKTTGTGHRDRTARTAQPGLLGRTVGIEQLGQDNQDKTARTGELGQESQKDRQDSTARIKDWTAWTGEPGQNREDKSGHESNTRTAASGKPWTRLLEQDSWHRAAGTGQPEKTVRTVPPVQKTENNTAITGQQGQDKGIGQP
jgi:hypothetical protein